MPQQLIHSTPRISYYTQNVCSLIFSIIILLTFEFVVRQEEEEREREEWKTNRLSLASDLLISGS